MTAPKSNAPYKILKRDGQWAVVNNTGEVKAKFGTDRARALKYLRALYASVPGAAKQADKTKFTGKARNKIPKRQAAGLIQGDDLRPDDLASATDAALDAAAMQIMANSDDVSSLPGWVQQVISLTLAAGATVDTLLEAMGINDPDDDDADDDSDYQGHGVVDNQAASDTSMSQRVLARRNFQDLQERARTFAAAREKSLDAVWLEMAADLSSDQRKKWADQGIALSDGSFPIPSVAYLKKAIQAFGRANPGDRGKVKAHIKKRARALGAENLIPEGW